MFAGILMGDIAFEGELDLDNYRMADNPIAYSLHRIRHHLNTY